LTAYMREQGFSEPREKAGKLIEQLQERNFILCYRGADTYSFVHRTFLEYFCATEIVNRFNKRGTEGGMTLEVLRDEIFGQHWQDETWHEVLQLICGLVDAEFAGELIEFLMGVEVERTQFLVEEGWHKGRLKPEGLMNLLLAADCFSDVENPTALESLGNSLLAALQQEVEQQEIELSGLAAEQLIDCIARYFPNALPWLKEQILHNAYNNVRQVAVRAIAWNYQEHPETLHWLTKQAEINAHEDVRQAAVWAIAENYADPLEILPWLKEQMLRDAHEDVRQAVVSMIAQQYKERPDTLPWLKEKGQFDPREDVRRAAVSMIAREYTEKPDTLPWLKERVLHEVHPIVLREVVEVIALFYRDQLNTFSWLKELMKTSSDLKQVVMAITVDILECLQYSFFFVFLKKSNYSQAIFFLRFFIPDFKFKIEELQDKSPEEILEFLLEQNPEEAEPILREVAQNYPDEAVRNWAQGRLVDS
jgi:HEAT repeats